MEKLNPVRREFPCKKICAREGKAKQLRKRSNILKLKLFS